MPGPPPTPGQRPDGRPVAGAADAATRRTVACAVVERLRAAGHTAYFAGGCVRDEVLGLDPTDYDVATDAPPEVVRKHFPGATEVGAQFGVVLVRTGRDAQRRVVTEVATFRQDGAYLDARRPSSVQFSDARADAQRRDFTINALFLDPLSPPGPADVGTAGQPLRGRLIDLVHGVADLKAKVVRAVGDPTARLREDHLRALRAVRFAARLGFQIEPQTARAISAEAAALTGVSRERIGDELRRMLEHPSRAEAAAHFEGLGLAASVFSGLPTHADPSPRFPRLRGLRGSVAFADALAAYLADRAPNPVPPEWEIDPLVRTVSDALCLSNAEADRTRDVLADRADILKEASGWRSATEARQRRRVMRDSFGAALQIVGVEAPEVAGAVSARLAELRAHPGEPGPTPLIDGSVLIGLGFKPGPVFKRVLDQVYDAQLEGRVTEPAAAAALARQLAGVGGVGGTDGER
jgi:poly(A) polymerase